MSAAFASPEAPSATPLRAARDRVDVWVVRLAARASDAAYATLSDPEREFAGRLRLGAGAWVSARAALRGVLGRYLDIAPGRMALETEAGGKPRLAPGAGPDLRFNLSHSGDVALVAVRLGHEVGVDVEALRPGVDFAAIARDVFAVGESPAAVASGAGDSRVAFFRSWVGREALAKATGRGIVSAPTPEDAARFTVRGLDGIPGYAAAVASEGGGWNVRRFEGGAV